MKSAMRQRLARAVGRFGRSDDGVASIEFSIVVLVFAVAVLNVGDIALYIIKRMEVQAAANMAALATWKTCDSTHLPATSKCAGMNSAVASALQGTSLGASATLKAGSLTEGYYCLNGSYALTYVSNTASKPADCAAAGQAGLQPGDYVTLTVTYPYAPLFPGITVTNLLPTPLTSTAWVRLG